MKVAKFRVINPVNGELIKQYEIQYANAENLNTDYHEARQIWAEYHVEADTPDFLLSYSHTWKEQFVILPFAI